MDTKLTICGYEVKINDMLPPGTFQVSADVAQALKKSIDERILRDQVELTGHV